MGWLTRVLVLMTAPRAGSVSPTIVSDSQMINRFENDTAIQYEQAGQAQVWDEFRFNMSWGRCEGLGDCEWREINITDLPISTAGRSQPKRRAACTQAAPRMNTENCYLPMTAEPIRVPIISPEITSSTRRFCCRPDAVSLEATG